MNVYIGHDPREEEAYEVARASLLRHTKEPVSIVPLKLEHLGGVLTRPIERRGHQLWCPISNAPMATEFAISRFTIPFLQDDGWALFIDCDMLFRSDVSKLFDLTNESYAVMVVKHAQRPTEKIKMDGQLQTFYNRKNWSSVVLWNCAHPAHCALTKEQLNSLPGRDLHAFSWLKDEEIGSLPPSWNHLVGVSEDSGEVNLAHFTLGTPNMAGYEESEFANEWRDYHRVRA